MNKSIWSSAIYLFIISGLVFICTITAIALIGGTALYTEAADFELGTVGFVEFVSAAILAVAFILAVVFSLKYFTIPSDSSWLSILAVIIFPLLIMVGLIAIFFYLGSNIH